MKIRIIGYAGSGKTSLAIKIQEKFRIQGISLDDYLKIKDKEQRTISLKSRLETLDAWVIEGVQVSQWTNQSILDADLVVVLDYPILLSQFRVTKRGLKQISEKNRSWAQRKKIFKRIFKLYKWNRRFQKRLPTIKKNLYQQRVNVMILEMPEHEKRLFRSIRSYQRKERQHKQTSNKKG